MSRRLDVIEQVITCQNCELHKQCTSPVAFSGQTNARFLVVGEAPGQQEDEEGEPFVGPAGQHLRQALMQSGITDLDEVAFANTVSCFPHGTPELAHVQACAPNRTAQIRLFKAPFVLLTGKVAMKAIRSDLDLKHGRRRPFQMDQKIYMVSYHPSYALRDQGKGDLEFRKDVAAFVQMVEAGVHRWNDFIPDNCSACVGDAVWWDRAGLGWCVAHLSPREEELYNDRMALIQADYDAAKARVDFNFENQRLTGQYLGADADWMEHAWAKLCEYFKTHDEFFVDDFWDTSGLGKPTDARALGSLVQRAARDGLIEKTGEFRKSKNSNGSEKPIWAVRIATTNGKGTS